MPALTAVIADPFRTAALLAAGRAYRIAQRARTSPHGVAPRGTRAGSYASGISSPGTGGVFGAASR